MSDMLAKATVEFIHPIHTMKVRLFENDESKGFKALTPLYAGNHSYMLEFSERINEPYIIDMKYNEMCYRLSGDLDPGNISITKRILFDFHFPDLIKINHDETDVYGIVFSINKEVVKRIIKETSQILCYTYGFTFTVRRKENEEPKVSTIRTIRDIVPVYMSQFDKFKGYVDDKLAYLEGSISALIKRVSDNERKKDD